MSSKQALGCAGDNWSSWGWQLGLTCLSFSPQDAKYHMQRCIDSGLWVPNSKSSEAKEGEEAGPGDPLLETVKPDEKDVSA